MWWLDVLETAIGGLLLALVLLTETQERALQSWLEAAWIRLDDTANHAVSYHMRFMHRVAVACNAVLEALFGKRILSLRGVLVSATLGLSLFLVALWIAFYFADDVALPKIVASTHLSVEVVHRVIFVLQSCVALAGFFLLVFALLPAMLKPTAVPAWTILAVLLWICTLGPCISAPSAENTLDPFFLAICVGSACDLLFVNLLRLVFRHASRTQTFAISISLILGSVVLGLSAISIPIILLLFARNNTDISFSFILAALNNTAVVIIAMSPLWIVLAFAAHKLIWPPINGMIYVLQRYKIVPDQKVALIYTGLTLVVSGMDGLPDWLASLPFVSCLAVFALGLGIVVLGGSVGRAIADRSHLKHLDNALAATKQGEDIVAYILSRFSIDTTDMAPEDRKTLAITQLVERRYRLRLWIGFASAVILLAATFIFLTL